MVTLKPVLSYPGKLAGTSINAALKTEDVMFGRKIESLGQGAVGRASIKLL